MAIKWLNSRGVIASGESETVLNSTTEQKARTWDDGTGAKRPFNSHLKPSEAIHPDRCVRVYFDYDEKRAKTGGVPRRVEIERRSSGPVCHPIESNHM